MRRASPFLFLAVAGCTAGPGDALFELAFTPDPGPPGSEAYLCFAGDASPLAGRPIHDVTFSAQPGPVVLHHLQLFAIVGDYPDGPVECEGIPEHSVELDVFAPTGPQFYLPAGVGLALPEGARRIVAQAHVLRTAAGGALEVRVGLRAPAEPPAHLAGYLRLGAPVPAIRPRTVETATSSCRIGAPLHTVATWPHMHRIGAEFHGVITRADGRREALVDVVPWIFDEQRIYPVEAELAPGDALETDCVWRNDSDDYVLPGPKSWNEMCSQAVIAWPLESAVCDG